MARDVMTRDLIVGYADDTLADSLRRMTDNNISHLPIVDEEHPELLVGLITMSEISRCYEN